MLRDHHTREDRSTTRDAGPPPGIRRWLRPVLNTKNSALANWREKILFAVLVTALILSLAAFVPAVMVGIRERLWGLVIIDLAVYLGVWFLFIFRGLHYELRALGATVLVYLVGLNVCVQVGLFSGGPAYLFTCAILAGLLIGLRAAVAAVVINGLTLVILGLLTSYGRLPGQHLFFSSMARALAAGTSFILVNAVSAISAAVLVRGLHHVTTRQTALTEELYRERKELLEIRNRLKEENLERRRSEAALRRSEAQYRLLTENIKDIIFTLDMELNYTYVSPAVENLQGWLPHEMVGANIATALPPHSLELAANTFEQQLALSDATGDYHRSIVLEIELLCKDGTTVWSEVTAAFLLGSDARPNGILGVVRDISQRRRERQKREALQEQLVRSKKMEALGLMAGGVAHDLNNVLSGIVSYPDLLMIDMDEAHPMYHPIRTIRESGQKAAAIVQDLLTLARRGVVTTEVLNLNILIREYLSSPEHKKIVSFHPAVDIRTELEEHLPNVSGSVVHLKKTLMNLVSNAAEAQPNGGVITIQTCSQYLERPVKGYDRVVEGEYIVVTVSDRGQGIAPVDLPHIFEPFYTKKIMGRSGTGLGLAVVWGTVQDHHGYIDVHSDVGKGTSFSLYFPMTSIAASAKDTPMPVGTYNGHGETVLVVDDVELQRKLAVDLLTRLNYKATSVSSGEDAIAYVQNHKVDLLVLDMIMDPGLDGLDTYRQILAHHPHQRAIIASGFAETGRVKEAQRLGAAAYIRKPYTIEKIGLAVYQALNGPKK
jgi:PAS domain S-box-containing protein